MNTIRYNTNSSLIQRFQKNDYLKREPPKNNNNILSYDGIFFHNQYMKSTTTATASSSSSSTGSTGSTSSTSTNDDDVNNTIIEQDPPFTSSYPKNSTPYLKELCFSIYPKSIYYQINDFSSLNDGSLEFNAVLALIVKNFVKYWYGPKICTDDTEFLERLFEIFHNLTKFVTTRTKNIDMIRLLLNDIPVILSEHIRVIKQLNTHQIHDSSRYKTYCNLSMIENDRYPFVITDLIKDSLSCESVLQNAFLDSLFNQFLFGRILDSCLEPYYFLRMLTKLADKIIEDGGEINNSNNNYNTKKKKKHQKVNYCQLIFQKWLFKLTRFYNCLITISLALINGPKNKTDKISNDVNVLNSYVWTLINIEILSLNNKRPIFYMIFCYIQHFMLLSISIIRFIDSYFVEKFIWGQVLPSKNIKHSFNSIRTLLFPNDNLMGPRTIIPTEEEFENFKLQCTNKLIKVVQLKRLDSTLGITKDNIIFFIDMICQEDTKINKTLLFRIIDCLIAHLTQRK